MNRWGLMLGACLLATTLPLVSGAASADEKNEKNEKTVSLDSIPAPARDALLREAAGAPILKVEEETKNGQKVYEAHVKQGNDIVSIHVDPAGKLVSKHTKKGEHEKNK